MTEQQFSRQVRRTLQDGAHQWSRHFLSGGGRKGCSVILLLHGFPTSSSQFRNLIPRLAGSFRLIAPDYPGYGQSSMPDRKKFSYTFDNFAAIVDQLLGQLGVGKYTIYTFDYGAPVGYRLALLHPERVTGLIVQNGNAYAEGLRNSGTRSRSIGPPQRIANRYSIWSMRRRPDGSMRMAWRTRRWSIRTRGPSISFCSIARETGDPSGFDAGLRYESRAVSEVPGLLP